MGNGEAKTLTFCLCPRRCCVLGNGYAWTPPAPTPQPPPPTSTTPTCGRPSTSLSSFPTGTCASEALWPAVAPGVAGAQGSWVSERFRRIPWLGFLVGALQALGVDRVLCRLFNSKSD